MSLSVWFTQLEEQETQRKPSTVPYPPSSLTSSPYRNDVTGQLEMSCPHPLPLFLSPLSTLLQSLASHCGLGPSIEHVPNLGREAAMLVCHAANIKLYNYANEVELVNKIKVSMNYM